MTESSSLLLLGFMSAAWLFTVGGGIYVVWRYVHSPWKSLRADISALNQERLRIAAEVSGLKQEIGLRQAATLSDADLARMERKMNARKGWDSGTGGG